jgi:hypothetical protein
LAANTLIMVGDPLASILRSGRELFNAKFQQARRRYPNLDPQAFSVFLSSTLDPLVRQLSISAESLSFFVQSAYDAALELAGERLIGVDANTPSLSARAWLEILPRVPVAVLGSGEAVLGAVSNAAHNLSKTSGARPNEWIRGMAELAADCQTLPEFLQIGQVLAWRAGMAHYRRSALEVAAQLREPLVRAALKIPANTTLADALDRLKNDLWYNPATSGATDSPRVIRPVRRVGTFRGFGGNFLVPPIIAASDDQLFVSSGDDAWLLTADVFGQTLHRATTQEFEAARERAKSSATDSVQVSANKITTPAGTASITMPGTVTSFAVLPHTIAVTSSATHAIQLVAR